MSALSMMVLPSALAPLATAPRAFAAPEIDWAAMSPILIVFAAALIGVLVEAFAPVKARRTVQLIITLTATVAAFGVIVWLWMGLSPDSHGIVAISSGGYVVDRFALFAQGTLLVLGALSMLFFGERTQLREDAFAPQASSVPGSSYEEAARRAGLVQTEVFPLAMISLMGMMIFAAAGDLIVMFVALEILSLPLYLLVGLSRRRRLLSQEASLKYFLLGAFASALFLFGTALIYGFSGSLNLGLIAATASGAVGLDGVMVAGIGLLLVGLLFKIGAVPFHSWMPDVYQGAPTPVTAFMAAATKLAGFAALLRVMYVVLVPLSWDWAPVLWAIAVLTMLVGSIIALTQTDMKRMVAYSSVAHAGFILVGVAAAGQRVDGTWSQGISGVLFYLAAYGITTLGAFGVIYLVREKDATGAITAEATHISQWTGLGRRSPLLASSFAFFLLAFAGIPLTSGFVGKFAVFAAAVDAGSVWPVVLGVIASAIAVFFYVRIIVLMFFTDSTDETVTVVKSRGPVAIVIGIAVAVTLVLGVVPGPLLELAEQAAKLIQ